MSSNQMRNFGSIENPPSAHNHNIVDRGMTYQNTDPSQLSHQERDLQTPYPGLNGDGLVDHSQAYQGRARNKTQAGLYEPTTQTAGTSVPPQTPQQYRAYDRAQYAAASHNPITAAQYDSQTFQYSSNPGISVTQAYSTQPMAVQERQMSYTPISIQRKAVPYPSPPSQGHELRYPSPAAHELGMQHSSPPSQRNASPYSPLAANATLTPDRSTIGSPLPQMSPNSLQRELEKTKDYAENILTKLIETQRMLDERDAEVARLHDRLANSGARSLQQHGGDQSSHWELEDLRRKLHEQGQALRAAQDDAARTHSLAQYQQSQAEWYSQELFQLKQSQSRIQQSQVNPAQLEEARNVTEFYKQKVDHLSRDNMSIAQQNRKLTEDLAAAQRKAHQQKIAVDSTR